jgi:hypothetical protein
MRWFSGADEANWALTSGQFAVHHPFGVQKSRSENEGLMWDVVGSARTDLATIQVGMAGDWGQ